MMCVPECRRRSALQRREQRWQCHRTPGVSTFRSASPRGPAGTDNYYPYVTGTTQPYSACPTGTTIAATPRRQISPCSGAPGLMEANCAVTTLERFHHLVQLGGEEFFRGLASPVVVSGGEQRHHRRAARRHDLCHQRRLYPLGCGQGYWSLLRKSALVGNTQSPRRRAARQSLCLQWRAIQSQWPAMLACDRLNCGLLSIQQTRASAIPLDIFSVNQRLFNIYDGPSYPGTECLS